MNHVAALALLATIAAPQDDAPDSKLDIELIRTPALRLAVRDATGSYEKHAEEIGTLYMWLGMAAIEPAGRLIGIYPDDPAEVEEASLRWAVAVPVAADAQPPKPLRVVQLPPMQAVSYVTTIALLDEAKGQVSEWLETNEMEVSGTTRMEYLTEAGTPEEMRVRIVIPVRSTNAPGLEDIAFIAGEWHGSAGESRLLERWSAPVGDSMLGALQWVRPDGVWMYELMNIQQRSDGVLFQLRHFDRNMKPWEDPESPLRMRLVEAADGRAVFDNLDTSDELGKLVFERKDDQLAVTLIPAEGIEQDDRVFVFSRAED